MPGIRRYALAVARLPPNSPEHATIEAPTTRAG
jgi:hypothetical protein